MLYYVYNEKQQRGYYDEIWNGYCRNKDYW